MNRRFISGTAAALTAIAALLGGCGGGGDTTGTASNQSTEAASQPSKETTSQASKESSPPAKVQVTKVVLKPQAPLSRQQFIRRADPVCGKYYEERGDILLKYARRAASLSKSEKEQVLSEAILPSFRHDLESLEKLAKQSAPKGDEAKLEELLETYASLLAESEADPSLVLANAAKQFAVVTKLARAYGFEVCGSF
jgi:hypothetical protein